MKCGKRVLSVVLSILMLLSVVPATSLLGVRDWLGGLQLFANAATMEGGYSLVIDYNWSSDKVLDHMTDLTAIVTYDKSKCGGSGTDTKKAMLTMTSCGPEESGTQTLTAESLDGMPTSIQWSCTMDNNSYVYGPQTISFAVNSATLNGKSIFASDFTLTSDVNISGSGSSTRTALSSVNCPDPYVDEISITASPSNLVFPMDESGSVTVVSYAKDQYGMRLGSEKTGEPIVSLSDTTGTTISSVSTSGAKDITILTIGADAMTGSNVNNKSVTVTAKYGDKANTTTFQLIDSTINSWTAEFTNKDKVYPMDTIDAELYLIVENENGERIITNQMIEWGNTSIAPGETRIFSGITNDGFPVGLYGAVKNANQSYGVNWEYKFTGNVASKTWFDNVALEADDFLNLEDYCIAFPKWNFDYTEKNGIVHHKGDKIVTLDDYIKNNALAFFYSGEGVNSLFENIYSELGNYLLNRGLWTGAEPADIAVGYLYYQGIPAILKYGLPLEPMMFNENYDAMAPWYQFFDGSLFENPYLRVLQSVSSSTVFPEKAALWSAAILGKHAVDTSFWNIPDAVQTQGTTATVPAQTSRSGWPNNGTVVDAFDVDIIDDIVDWSYTEEDPQETWNLDIGDPETLYQALAACFCGHASLIHALLDDAVDIESNVSIGSNRLDAQINSQGESLYSDFLVPLYRSLGITNYPTLSQLTVDSEIAQNHGSIYSFDAENGVGLFRDILEPILNWMETVFFENPVNVLASVAPKLYNLLGFNGDLSFFDKSGITVKVLGIDVLITTLKEIFGKALNALPIKADLREYTPCKESHLHLSVVPEKAPTCVADGYQQHWKCDGCGKLFKDENGEAELDDSVVIPKTGHNWMIQTWEWIEGSDTGCNPSTTYSAEVVLACQNDNQETVAISKNATKATTDATCTEEGETSYTATVECDGQSFTESKIIPINPLGHNWDTPVYSWVDDNSTVTATIICKRDNTHQETETVETTGEITKEPGCEEDGLYEITAEFDNELFEKQTKGEAIPKIGHDYQSSYVEQTGTEEGYTLYTCSRCGDQYRVLDPAVAVDGLLAYGSVNAINLSWLKAVEASVTGYKLYRKTAEDDSFIFIADLSSRNTTSYTDLDVTVGTKYFYIVRAMKDNVEGEPSQQVSAAALPDGESPVVTSILPESGTTITKTVNIKASAVDNVEVVKFTVLYSFDEGVTWNEITSVNGASCSISFDTTTVPDGKLMVKVIAFDALDNASDGTMVNTYYVDNSAPAIVENLSVVVVYAAQLTLSWSKPEEKDVSHFILQQKTGEQITTVSSNVTTLGYNVSGLVPDTTYEYRVAAVDQSGNVGEYSDWLSVTTLADETAPVIKKVKPAPGRFSQTIPFSVEAQDDYTVKRIILLASQDLTNWTEIEEKVFTSTLASRSQSFTVSLSAYDEGNLYLAAVAFDEAGNSSPYGNEAAYVQYIVDRTPPAAPIGVKAVGHDRQIEVRWTQGGESDIGKYSVYRAEGENSAFSVVASDIARLNYFDANVRDGITYYYKVAVNDTSGNTSEFSDVVFANLIDDAQKPVIKSLGLGYGTVAGSSNRTIGALAQDNKVIRRVVIEYKKETENNYNVFAEQVYSQDRYYQVLEHNLPLESFADGDRVVFRAYCEDGAGLVSDYCGETVVTIDKTAPGITNVSYDLNGNVYTLSWSGNHETDVSGYRVYTSKNGGTYKLVASRAYAQKETYSVSVNLDAGSYNIKIEAVDKVGNTSEYLCDPVAIQGGQDFNLQAVIDCPSYFEVGVEETISAEQSFSSDHNLTYNWTISDGTSFDGSQFVKSFSAVGSYEVTLTITDSNHNSATATKTIVVKEREMLGTVRVQVVDDSSSPVRNASVYFGLGEDGQQIVRTDSSGYAVCVMSVGAHSVGALGDTSIYLPAESEVNVLANHTTDIKLILVGKPLIDLDLEWHEMTLDEIIAAGIDVSDPANRQLITGTIIVTYSTSVGEQTSAINYIRTPDRIIDYTVSGGGYDFTPIYIKTEDDREIVAVLTMPVGASFLKQFYEVSLYVANNAERRFSISECAASLNVPTGLSIVKSTSIDSVIAGGSSSAATWIVRGDEAGSYPISASFSGNLDVFNKPVYASVSSGNPIVVRGLEGITLRAVFNSMIKKNTLYYNMILENNSGYDIYYPNVDYQYILDNLMIYAPKKDPDAVIKTECLGVSLINSEDTAETFEVDKEFEILHDGEKLKYEFKTSGLANDEVVGYYKSGIVECAPQFKDHIVVEEGYIYSYDGEEEIVKYAEKYKDLFQNQNGIVLRFFDNSKLTEYKVDYFVGSKSGEEHKALDNVTVEYGNGKVQTVNEEFAAKYVDVKGSDITIRCNGYRVRVIPAETIDQWATYFSISQKILIDDVYLEKDHKDGKPYITAAYGKEMSDKGIKTYTDLLGSKLEVTGVAPCEIILKAACGSDDLTNATFYLSQDDDHRLSSDTGVFSNIDIKHFFDKDKEIYAYVISKESTQNNESKPVELQIEIIELESFTETLLKSSTISLVSTEGQSVEIGDDTPLIGGSTISMNLLSFPIGVEIEGSTVKASLGVDIFSHDYLEQNKEKKNKWFDFKASVNKWKKGFNEAKKKYESSVFGPVADRDKTFTLDFLGYIEGEIVNGGIKITEYSASLKGDFSYQYTQQGAIYCIPVYAYVKAAVEVVANASRARQIADSNVPFDFGLELKIAPSLRLGAGAGFQGVISGGVFANGVIEFTNNFHEKYRKLKMTGTFGVEAEVFFLKWEKGIYEGTWTPIDGYYGDGAKSTRRKAPSNQGEDSFTDAELVLVSREYLEDTSEWNAVPVANEIVGATTGILQESVYANSQVQMVQMGDKLMQVYVEDDASRDTYNFAKLVYSVFDSRTNAWTTPKPVCDNGRFDSAPKLCSDAAGNVYVVWQKLDTKFSASNATLDNIMKSAEIYYARYDKAEDTFVDVAKISDDACYDFLPQICVENGGPVAYWIKNTANDLTHGGNNALVRCAIGETPTILANGLQQVSDLACTNGKASVLVDADGDLATAQDTVIATYDLTGTQLAIVDSWSYNAITYSEDTLYYTTDNEIGYLAEDGEATLIVNAFAPANLTVTDDGVYWNENDAILYAKYEDDGWSQPVQLAKNDGGMTNLDVVQTQDYTYCVYNNTAVLTNDDGSEAPGTTDLMFTVINKYVDLSAYLYEVNEQSVLEGEDDNVTVYVANSGNTTVNSIRVEMTDTLGFETAETFDVKLKPGEGTILTLTYTPETYENTILSVTVSDIASTQEKTPDDNVMTQEVGLCDLLIEENGIDQIGENYFLSAVISNVSRVTANRVTVKTYFGSKDSAAVDTQVFDTLANGENLHVSIPVCKDNLTFEEDGTASVYVTVAARSNENMTENNTVCFVLRTSDKRCGHPLKTLVSTVEPTCEEAGSKTFVCEACGSEVIEELAPNGHDFGDWTANGDNHTRACLRENCNSVETFPHEWNDGEVTKEATCKEAGEMTFTCAVCQTTKIEPIAKLTTHTPADPVKENEILSTYTKPGSYDEVVCCAVCGDELSRKTIVTPIIDHVHQFESAVTKESTCKEEGIMTNTCILCGESNTKTLSALGHVDTDNDGHCDRCREQMAGGNHCAYCGKIHDGFFGWLVRFFHKILALFKR